MIRKDIYTIEIQQNFHMLVFHKTYNGGFGSAVSLYFFNFEFLKFDCFGLQKGHYHIYDQKTNPTIYFKEQTAIEQIEKTASELKNNIQYYLEKSPNGKIKNFSIDMGLFIDAIDKMRLKMIEYEITYYSHSR